jgi:CTP:molybdopterin cytidylyltransferase MocA
LTFTEVSCPALILAAGASRRMGSIKALLEVEGRPLLLQALERLREAGAGPIWTVLGFHREVLEPLVSGAGGQVLVNQTPEEGQLSSLRTGLKTLDTGAPGVLVLPVDHGLVTVRTVQLILEAAREDPTRFAVPSFEGRRGHPTWFPRECFEELLDPALEGGARTVMRRRGEAIRHLVVADPGARLDLDTLEDWEASRTWRA